MFHEDRLLRERLIKDIGKLSYENLLRVARVVEELRGEPEVPPAPLQDNASWPHAPLHRISEHGTYIVTAGTAGKKHYFRGPARLTLLEGHLLRLARQHGWNLEAWAVFSNHYHFVGHSQQGSSKLNVFLRELHVGTAIEINRDDEAEGREVWYNFWDTQLTYERSYLARLNYVHQNPVKHGLVRVANEYRWCSAAWFERTAKPAQVKTIYSFKTDHVHVFDDFVPEV